MRVLGERALVLYGTRTERSDLERVLIGPRTPAGIALRLSAPTYFYVGRTSVAIAKISAIRALGVLCPPGVFHELEALLG